MIEHNSFVIPANAGTHVPTSTAPLRIPAFAGMTLEGAAAGGMTLSTLIPSEGWGLPQIGWRSQPTLGLAL